MANQRETQKKGSAEHASYGESDVGIVERRELSPAELRVPRWGDGRLLILLTSAFGLFALAELMHFVIEPSLGKDFLFIIEFLTHSLSELAVACFIAFIVAGAIESGSRRELNAAVQERIRKVQLNVFYSTFERHIPKRIVAEVDALVFAAPFVRLWHVTDYTLRIIDMNAVRPDLPKLSIVEVEQVTSYEIRNVDAVTRPFMVHAGLERPPYPSLYEEQSIILTQIEWGGLSQKIPEPRVEVYPHHTVKIYDFGSLEPGATVRVELRARLFKLLNDYEIWRSVHPTDNVTLMVHLPREPVDYNVFSLHRLGLREVRLGALSTRYETLGAMLPYQGILFWWRFDPTALGPPAAPAT